MMVGYLAAKTVESNMTDKEKVEQLEKIVNEARNKLQEAIDFADKHALTFRWDHDYGSRKQWYVGKGTPTFSEEGKWTSSSDSGC
jgi:hypothetical protein